MRIELEYPDGSVETFFANVPDGSRRYFRANRITLIEPGGRRCTVKSRSGLTSPDLDCLPEYDRRCAR